MTDMRDKECPVCYRTTHARCRVRLECAHTLCHPCARQWILRQPTCPLCRCPTHFFSRRTRSMQHCVPVMRRFAHAVAVLCMVLGPIDTASDGQKLAHGLLAIADRMVCARAHVWYRPHMQQSLQTMHRLLMMIKEQDDPFHAVRLSPRERDVMQRVLRVTTRRLPSLAAPS